MIRPLQLCFADLTRWWELQLWTNTEAPVNVRVYSRYLQHVLLCSEHCSCVFRKTNIWGCEHVRNCHGMQPRAGLTVCPLCVRMFIISLRRAILKKICQWWIIFQFLCSLLNVLCMKLKCINSIFLQVGGAFMYACTYVQYPPTPEK